MDLTGAFKFRSGGVGPFREARWLESLHLGGGGDDKFQQLTKLIPENAGGFKLLIKLPPAQAVELLYFSDSPSSSSQAAADGSDIDASLCVFDGLAIEFHKRLESFHLEPKVVLSISQTELCRA
ncbi:unnamed protein product [Brassica oleracea var. botrytis]|uniref:(rape) hypothetical protein n=1 Tax=Brassica napus TaxID=3708 RepID=A0A078H0A9_BRANA|nr:unnamed protein product [Brassica napus]CDY30917.1 BnaC09g14890D [Brassica napus]